MEAALGKALAEFGQLKGIVDAVSKNRPVPKMPALSEDPAWEAMDEAFFNVRLHAARVGAALESFSKGWNDHQAACSASAAELRVTQQRVKEYEEKEQLGPILGAQFMVESWKASGGRLLSNGGGPARAQGALRADDATTAPCSCCAEAGMETGSGGGGCVHRTVLAAGIIDKTFEEHRRWLRQRVADLEAELQGWKTGETAKALQSTNDALRRALVEKNNELEEFRRRSLAAVAAASRHSGARLADATVVQASDAAATSGEGRAAVGAAATRRLEQLQRDALADKSTLHADMCSDVLLAAMGVKLSMFLDEWKDALLTSVRPTAPRLPSRDTTVLLDDDLGGGGGGKHQHRTMVDRPMGGCTTPRNATDRRVAMPLNDVPAVIANTSDGSSGQHVAAPGAVSLRGSVGGTSIVPMKETRTSLPMVPPVGGSGVTSKPIHVRVLGGGGGGSGAGPPASLPSRKA